MSLPMSHGVLCEPNDALFFIDHDWDNHGGGDWCNRFVSDVIRALEQIRSPGAQIMSNVLPFEKRSEKISGDESDKPPATKIVLAVMDLENRVGEAARAINKAYDAELKKEMALEIAHEDSFLTIRNDRDELLRISF
jgi:hypothetical protein